MITKTQSYSTSDGQIFATLEEAQKHELYSLLKKEGENPEEYINVVNRMMESKDKLLDILTTGPRSLPKARKVNGGTKKRTTTQPEGKVS